MFLRSGLLKGRVNRSRLSNYQDLTPRVCGSCQNYPSGRISERIYERSEVIDVPKISHQENVEAVENILQEGISVRSCEQSEVIDVTKI